MRKEREGTGMTVQCYDCGKTFKTNKMFPTCPKCGSEDIDLPEED